MLPRNISRRAESWADANFACTLCRYASEDGPIKELLGDPSTCNSEVLSARINDLSPSRRLRCIVSLILRGFESPEEKKRVMSLPESLVWDIMDELLQSLENSKSCEGCVGREMNLRRMMVALSRSAKILPRSLSLHGVTLSTKDPINGGGYADIFRATYQGQAVALKRLRTFTNAPPSEKQKAAFRREALVSWFLDHPNVQVFLGIDEDAFSSQGLLCIVTPWQNNGNIMDCLRRLKEIGVPLLVDEWGNILIDNHYQPKLADFGLSMLSGSGSMTMGSHSGPRGTLRFMAPELFVDENSALSLKSDIYAFGCVCVEAISTSTCENSTTSILILLNS
ncbi:hypothetical protein NLI96_g4265 [Meripilus lineatus]|uniref:Protein kinase domain-containing protein n=1 Tax=Meripilus lineatus TaxID=2056292 RepID=A0AAD5YFV5_9APHY|nr:hypothetical protein NLI96_g4265 [Physisporinus lineatus]